MVAVEPHAHTREQAARRVRDLALDRAEVLDGSAAALPMPDRSVDVAHARFAYFFGPGCEPGLAELDRVLRPGGTAFVIDNDLRGGTFSGWLRRDPAWQQLDPEAIERFWLGNGFTIERIATRWSFRTRDDLEAVLRLELPMSVVERVIAEHDGLDVTQRYVLLHRTR